jgi:hypothetical protein
MSRLRAAALPLPGPREPDAARAARLRGPGAHGLDGPGFGFGRGWSV